MPETWQYRVEIFWSDEDDGYIAVVPDLPGCSAFGADRVTAAREINDAMTAWADAAAEMNRDMPAPSLSQFHKGGPDGETVCIRGG